MNDLDEFTQYHAELLDGHYDCMDRLVLNAYFPVGMTGGGLRSWWRLLRADDCKLNDASLREMAGTFSRRLTAFCTQQKIPLIEAQAGERKHELAEPHLPKDKKFSGLFAVITGNAPAPVWEVKRHEAGHIVDIRHRKKWPYVKHYYFHLIDPQWGHVTVRMCGYPPFGAQVILNGHEWVERQAQRGAGHPVVKSGNCFVAGSDLKQVNRVAARLTGEAAIERLRAVCERWIYSTCLIFALTREEQRRSRFAYQYSLFQMELSRNLLFTRGTVLDEVYQKLIDRTRAPLHLQQLKTIFGFSQRPQHRITRGREGPEVAKPFSATI